ncbi:PREDICTED: protein croquemort-like [Dinoponera quadriceps]|uniref:Protein croquemort-like n=1 Tax=Dinoponera quadriceps TaxID=609295 RepID=A0A6P3Y4R2_DINQU|nr:PREDICTED: protein croquemort-like [Dinoponera quadriceps]XP_014485902.1 PREDICTED: protein croquemort-like [Dinoponera quadriceps]XP_014485903.1 PREDICTED: protein croquemort-like [Dinoponera quadriceps]
MMSSYKKVVIILIFGVIITLFGVFTGSYWPFIYNWTILKVLTLTPTSVSYNMWQETPIPMYLKFYMFNWTNPDEFIASNVKPNFVEMGPYVFREIDYKVNQTWNDNGTVTFQRKKVWFFEESLSGGSLSDKITNLNPIAATVAFSARNKTRFLRELTEQLMVTLGEQIVLTKSVNALLFDGFNDTLLRIAKKLNATTLPYTKFAWFYARNGSDSYDGTFNMLTGSSNLYELGQVKEWNFDDKSSYYKGSCGAIKGTNGDLWPPLLNNSTVSIFINDICTSLNLVYENETTFQGLTGRKYIGDDKMLDNGNNVASRKCYCPDEDCGPSGTLNISNCKFGAPAFVSMPHFYLADSSYRDAITGMKPSREKHELSIVIEPTTGIPMQVKAQLQLNLLLEPVEYMRMFQNLTRTYIPMLWFTQEANLTANYASMVKVVLILPSLGAVTCFGIAGIGILILFIGIFIFIRNKWRREESQVLLSKQEDDVTDRADAWLPIFLRPKS